MYLLELIYKLRKKTVPYYAKYPLYLLIWKPVRKYINVVLIPDIPFSSWRIFFYRCLGYRIGKGVFIGMKCYMDDLEPGNTIIEDNVTISYGTFFATHGRGQKHTNIQIKRGVYIGMRCNILSGKEGIIIGENAIIGAGALVNQSIPDNAVAVGVPAKVIKYNDPPADDGIDHRLLGSGE
jgi:acetyltransferase-like isoleucine patch superfamily enzyme